MSLAQLKVMSAIESCRTAALGGHVARCEDCAYTTIAYNSCRNRHCPKCQGAAATRMDGSARGRAASGALLPRRLHAAGGDWRHRLPEQGGRSTISCSKPRPRRCCTIAADPKHLGARIGITAVLHTWGSAMTHHPHVHMIVPGGGISRDGSRWVSLPAALSPAGARCSRSCSEV